MSAYFCGYGTKLQRHEFVVSFVIRLWPNYSYRLLIDFCLSFLDCEVIHSVNAISVTKPWTHCPKCLQIIMLLLSDLVSPNVFTYSGAYCIGKDSAYENHQPKF